MVRRNLLQVISRALFSCFVLTCLYTIYSHTTGRIPENEIGVDAALQHSSSFVHLSPVEAPLTISRKVALLIRAGLGNRLSKEWGKGLVNRMPGREHTDSSLGKNIPLPGVVEGLSEQKKREREEAALLGVKFPVERLESTISKTGETTAEIGTSLIIHNVATDSTAGGLGPPGKNVSTLRSSRLEGKKRIPPNTAKKAGTADKISLKSLPEVERNSILKSDQSTRVILPTKEIESLKANDGEGNHSRGTESISEERAS